MEWIRVQDGKPKEGTFEVLVKVDEPFFGTPSVRMIVSYYEHENNEWRCDLTGRVVHHVTHWMFLPEPPKPEN